MSKTDFEKLFGLIKKDLGEDKIYKGNDLTMGSIPKYGIPSGLPKLDVYLGGKGGFPAGKIIEFYGFERCGKTTAALHAAVEWQHRGGTVMFIDTEMSFDPARARKIGVNPDVNFIRSAASTVEEIFEQILGTMDILEASNYQEPFLFIVDSVNGVPTKADAERDIQENERVGLEAKQIKRGIRKVNPGLDRLDCRPTVIFINHAVSKIGGFGKKSDSGGGHGIKFYASVRLEFAHMGLTTDKKEGRRLGQKIKISIEKLKGGEIEFSGFDAELTNAHGFDKWKGLKEAMVATGFAYLPKGGKVITILKDTAHEAQVGTTTFAEWVEQQPGGYNAVYAAWRKWSISQGIIKPWGGKANG